MRPTRTRRCGRIAAAGLASLAIASLTTACGSSQAPTSTTSAPTSATTAEGATTTAGAPTAFLDTRRIELAIEQSVLSQRHVHVKVICPKAVPQRKGHDFHCIATQGRLQTPFAVVQRNNEGYVTYSAE